MLPLYRSFLLTSQAAAQRPVLAHASRRLTAPLVRTPQQPHVIHLSRRKIIRVKEPRKFTLVRDRYGSIEDLKAALALKVKPATLSECAVLVAIDTESEKRGLLNHVVEVGVTILRVRDIIGTAPGAFLSNWIAKLKHHHLVLDITTRPKKRMHSSLFGKSRFLSSEDAQIALKKILRECTGQNNGDSANPAVMLVGQSIDGDVNALRGPGVRLDIRDPATAGITFDKVFETLGFTIAARELGVRFPSGKLGQVVRSLGVDPKYVGTETDSVIGTHNASNDAAYTMMALLLYAIKWDDLIRGAPLAPTERVQGLSKKHLRSLGQREGAGVTKGEQQPMVDSTATTPVVTSKPSKEVAGSQWRKRLSSKFYVLLLAGGAALPVLGQWYQG